MEYKTMHNRKFSIPFPLLAENETVDEYLAYIAKYKNYIDDIFLGVPFLGNNYHNPNARYFPIDVRSRTLGKHTSECLELLEKSRGIFKRIITMNAGVYNYSFPGLIEYVDYVLVPFVDQYAVDGVICTDFNMACRLHELRPDLELHTSCNCFIETQREMEMWHDYAGINVFNPPRDFIRRPEKLKEMRATGYKLKYLVNGSCMFGCPQNKNHVMAWAVDNCEFMAQCHHNVTSNFFRGVSIVPRWLKHLDPYVDIYKISGRRVPLKIFKEVFEAYFYEKDDVNMGKITFGIRPGIYMGFLANEFPDKLLNCECKEYNQCFLCDRIARNSHKASRKLFFKKDYSEQEYRRLMHNIGYELFMQNSQKYIAECYDNEYGEFFEVLG